MVIIPRITATLPVLTIEDLRPAVGDRIEFVEDTGATYDRLEAFAGAAFTFTEQANAFAQAVDAAARAAGLAVQADALGAARGSVGYYAALGAAPITDADVGIGRELVLHNIAPDGTRPTSEKYIAESTPFGPRWAGPLVPTLYATAEAA